jgi:thiamine-phosphate diphosphorylase
VRSTVSFVGRDTEVRPPIVAMVTSRSHLRAIAGGTPPLDALVATIGRAARAGVDLVQVREPDLDGGDLLVLASRAMDETRGTTARVVINDRVDVALAAHAHGVHLPGRAPAASRVRAIAPEPFLIGRSVHSVEEAIAAGRDGHCDYLIFGTVFVSASKPAGHMISGVEALARVCSAVRLPVLAIGGMTVDRAAAVAEAGAGGIAAIGLFVEGEEDELRERIRAIRAAFRRD